VLRHSASIPFENLDVLLGRGIGLELAAVQGKLVAGRRGGYCFEQNSLLMAVLESLGFAVAPLSARVRVDRERAFLPPRTHLFLRVQLDGVAWLADVGVGGLSPTGPLRMDTEAEQATPHEPRRIVHEDGRWFHQARLARGWVDVCEFTGEQMPAIDRELANWWTSTNPGSKFRQNIMVSVAREDGTRVSFQNTVLTHRKGDGSGEVIRSEVVSDAERLREVLAAEFGLVVPAGTRFGLFGL
jgi:N-hydroxyarylamine O-acetyltransferase